MKTKLAFLAALLLASISFGADLPTAVPLWPGGAPGSEGHTAPEVNGLRGATVTVASINNPSLTPFLPPAGKATGAAVIIAPGGGHQFLSIEHEGYSVARALADHGVAGFVLKYRLAKEDKSPYTVEVHALMDAQRAIRLVRANAKEWNVNPDRVGFMGFSAGGELAVMVSTRFDKPVAGSHDSVDQLSCRPDFAAPIYPGGLTSLDSLTIPENAPPQFLLCASNDRDTIAVNIAQYYLKLKAAKIPVELHILNAGGHGFGLRPGEKPINHWTDYFMEWMADRKLLAKASG